LALAGFGEEMDYEEEGNISTPWAGRDDNLLATDSGAVNCSPCLMNLTNNIYWGDLVSLE